MAKQTLRVVELYSSIQGEGPLTGVPTIFCRFGGCNMRCPGWPCDTPYAIEPAQWRNSPQYDAFKLRDMINSLNGYNICFTGGEPTMQPPDLLLELYLQLRSYGYTFEMFTNGSLHELPPWIMSGSVHVMMDWKLPGSGEAETGRDIRLTNSGLLEVKDGIKFVIKDNEDFEVAIATYEMLRQRNCRATFWAGVAWGNSEAELINKIIERNLPWRFNIQTHRYIWPEATKGV
jgi:7-carboxy-7-deazaguanine synthase